MLIPETDARTLASDIMHIGYDGEIGPQFTDAGYPRITWASNIPKWEIFEKDCGDVSRLADRKIAAITTDNDYRLGNTATRESKWVTISTRKTAEKDKR